MKKLLDDVKNIVSMEVLVFMTMEKDTVHAEKNSLGIDVKSVDLYSMTLFSFCLYVIIFLNSTYITI